MEQNQLQHDAEELRKQASEIESEQMKTGMDTSRGSFAASVQSVADKAIYDTQKDSLTQPSLQRSDIASIMSTETKLGNPVKSGSFAASAQSVADRIANEANKK